MKLPPALKESIFVFNIAWLETWHYKAWWTGQIYIQLCYGSFRYAIRSFLKWNLSGYCTTWQKSTACPQNHKISNYFCIHKVLLCPLVSQKYICPVCFGEQWSALLIYTMNGAPLHDWKNKKCIYFTADRSLRAPDPWALPKDTTVPSPQNSSWWWIPKHQHPALTINFLTGRSFFSEYHDIKYAHKSKKQQILLD